MALQAREHIFAQQPSTLEKERVEQLVCIDLREDTTEGKLDWTEREKERDRDREREREKEREREREREREMER